MHPSCWPHFAEPCWLFEVAPRRCSLLPESCASPLSLCLSPRRLFELAGEHRLDIAHPSLCSDLDSTSLNIEFLRNNPHRVLRLTSWVDSLAPLFSFSFFQGSVVATLENAHSGGAATGTRASTQIGFHSRRTRIPRGPISVEPRYPVSGIL